MRLTLRTLLAYLDDTLEPLEIRTIGQKVAESETAQELISRIKQATRRRRITTPPATGPNAFEPNLVAEYLDNELSTEQVAELEKICLESDVHLAEVASCHQILTLVLGEPAVVPPTAKQRMYALVHGREAIPFRKAAAAGAGSSTPSAADHDADEMFLLGLPFYRRGSWLRWALPIAALVLFTVVGVALWQSIHGLQPQPSPRSVDVADNRKPAPDGGAADTRNKEGDKTNNSGSQNGSNPDKPPVKPSDNKDPSKPNTGSTTEPNTGGVPATPEPERKPEERPSASPTVRQEPPDTTRVKLGRYHTEGNKLSLLLQKGSDDWHRLLGGKDVYSVDQLVSLPGYASEIRLDCGIHLLLRGHIREFTPPNQTVMDYLQESVVVLHKPRDTDADLTLLRGRLYISNHKRVTPLIVRLRFEKKAWDLTLEPGAEWVVDLIKARDAGQPLSRLDLLLLSGKAGIALENEHFPHLMVPGPVLFRWFSTEPDRYVRLQVSQRDLDKEVRIIFYKTPIVEGKEAEGMDQALAALQRRMTADKPPLTALQEVLDTDKPFERRLAIYCLAALGEIKELMSFFGNSDAVHAPDRFFAFVALRRWLDRSPDHALKLYNPDTKKGILVADLAYTPSDAKRIIELLKDFTTKEAYDRDVFADLATDLLSNQVAIAELARWQLMRLSKFHKVNLKTLDTFNAARSRADREVAYREVMDKIDEGVLPPPLHPRKPGTGGGNRPAPPKGGGSKP